MNRDIVSRAVEFLRTELMLRDEDMDDVLDIAASSLARGLAEAKQALASRDAPKTALSAHTLKGNLRNLGLPDLADIARIVESAARDGGLAGLSERIDELERELGPLLTR